MIPNFVIMIILLIQKHNLLHEQQNGSISPKTIYRIRAYNQKGPFLYNLNIPLITGVNGYTKMAGDVSGKFYYRRFCNNYAVFFGIACHI